MHGHWCPSGHIWMCIGCVFCDRSAVMIRASTSALVYVLSTIRPPCTCSSPGSTRSPRRSAQGLCHSPHTLLHRGCARSSLLVALFLEMADVKFLRVFVVARGPDDLASHLSEAVCASQGTAQGTWIVHVHPLVLPAT